MENFMDGTEGSTRDRDILGAVAVDSVKVRCPKCYQPYKIFAADIKEPRPKFECRKCDTQFWLPFPEALNRVEQIGFPVSWLSVKTETSDSAGAENPIQSIEESSDLFERTCSNCGKRHALHLKECPHCLVLVEKADAAQQAREEGVHSTAQVRELWQSVVEQFENEEGHNEFLRQAELQSCMDYAAKRYQGLEQAMGSDPLITEMQGRIEALMTQATDAETRSPQATVKEVEVEPARKTSMRSWIRFSNFVLFCAVVVCLVGLSLPGGRNMVGVGAAIAFFSLALRLMQSR
ncbi:MAG: hypothetical protein HRT45_07600 [Bdellovibrionales bacterium]|nr:hypothetical protein [Bdellovibrionales bacterium]